MGLPIGAFFRGAATNVGNFFTKTVPTKAAQLREGAGTLLGQAKTKAGELTGKAKQAATDTYANAKAAGHVNRAIGKTVDFGVPAGIGVVAINTSSDSLSKIVHGSEGKQVADGYRKPSTDQPQAA